jgi:hypothetical protein
MKNDEMLTAVGLCKEGVRLNALALAENGSSRASIRFSSSESSESGGILKDIMDPTIAGAALTHSSITETIF